MKCWLAARAFSQSVDKKNVQSEWLMGQSRQAVRDRDYLYLFSRPFLWLIACDFSYVPFGPSCGRAFQEKRKKMFSQFPFSLQWRLITWRCIIFLSHPLKAHENVKRLKWELESRRNNQTALNSFLIHKKLTVNWSESFLQSKIALMTLTVLFDRREKISSFSFCLFKISFAVKLIEID